MSDNVSITNLIKMNWDILKVTHQWTDFVEKLLILMFSLERINIWEFHCIINFLYCENSLLLTMVQIIRFSLQSKRQGSDDCLLLSRSADLCSSFFLSFFVGNLASLVQKFTQLNFCLSGNLKKCKATRTFCYRHAYI